MSNFYHYLSTVTGIDEVYFYLILTTALVVIIFILIKRLAEFIVKRSVPLLKQYSVNQTVQMIINLLFVIIMFFVWDNYIKNIITLISIIGASLIVALREGILSFVGGLYIRVKRLFVTGDRIQIDDIIGDVMSVSTFDFDVLEISNDTHGQSTGIMITLPNSYVFTKNIKNYTKGFKYVWNELTMKVPVKCNLVNNKRELYKIVNNIENVKYIVDKMKVQSNVVGTTNNIYFSKYDPIIYTKIVDEHIELTIRYLVDPKKSRIVESMIWNKIFESYNEGKINLYLKG